ncbi:conjugal transfer protein TraN [Geobacter argillaceus]|uniref:Type IV conjugative transfer system TraN protein involved in mating pair stabilization n=1 Tax=Geobacter argillaceus TaxID=345631 RepID=A0A562VPH4_9BACT|nr:conjugal transfer protein TraN [Geobacter argillaceus]TWJ19694.1 type IV conjugative transfer system TraN protein involved in mating pair stabilization [Geobacter argillaceus]
MIFRLLYAVIYSLLIVALTGIPQTALAVVSCQDAINPNTSIRYIDSLAAIFGYNGKTYAIAKSATGDTSDAATFFDFSANITRAYSMTGDNTGSLKNLLSLGQYGAAMPVRIDSADTQKFILSIYGKYLGSTYIDAWKEFGAAGFTSIDGSALSYTNWASAAYAGPDPQAVIMGADGKWTSGQDGVRTTQIVQFDEVLDCAVLMPSPSDPPQPGTGSGSGSTTTQTPTPDLTKPVCGQDLNGNGYAGDPGETANCLQTAQGLLCPVGAVNCVESYSAPVCPAGSTLNTSRDMCQADATVTCDAGYTYDASIDKCVEPVTCPDGGTFNPVTDQCEKLVLNECPSGYTYDSTLDVCRKSADCAGGTLNPTKDRCEIPPTWNCPTGFSYNSTSGKCEASPYCPFGTTYNTTRDRCEAPLGSCPAGYTYNTVLDKCTAAVNCPAGGSLNGTTDKCEITSSISCPTGTTYNATTGKCESTPTCGSPGTYSTAYDLCLTPSPGAICPTGYTYNATYGTCISSPSCVGGTYSNVNNRCEATPSYSCPDASYTYNSSVGRCEKAPVCSQGTYNTTYNVCLQSIIHTCPSGYSYNSTTGRCEMTPTCPSGTTFNSITNRCEASTTSITGYTQPITGKTEIIKYKARGDTSTGITQYSTSPPALDSLSFDFILQNGQVVLKQECAWGGSGNCGCPSPHWNGWCRAGTDLTQTTSGNTLTVTATIYDWAYDWNSPYCAAGYTLADDGNGGYYCAGCPVTSSYYDYDLGQMVTYTYYNCSDTVYYPTYKVYTTGAAASAALSEFVSCPAGYTLTGPPSTSTCTTIVSQWGVQTGITDCTQAGLYSCTAPVNACNSGFTLSGSVCYQNPTCPNGSFDYGAHVCYASYTPTCPTGTTYDSSIGSCTLTPTCSNGLLDGNRDVCYQSANAGCASGYTLSGAICTATAYCASGGTLDGSIDFCKATATWNCPSGYSYSATYGQCYQTANCGAGSLNGSLDVCQQSYSRTCPSGYTLNGTTCQATPTCATGGSYNAALDLCDGGSNVCSSPLVLDPAVDKCYQTASCSGGTLNTATDKCEAAATANCGTWSWDGSAQVCYSPPVCNLGAYDATANECRATVTRNCGIYGWSSTQGKCTQQIVCPKDGGYALSNTVVYSPALDKCASDAQHTCPAGTTYNGLPIEKCEAVPVCTGDGIYNTTVHSCFLGMNTCPLGTQYSCMNNQGTMQCSPNQCFTAGASGTEQITTMDESMMQNDGQRDQNGNCLDQLYVFNGKASRCRPPGLTVGYLNNCCDSDKVGSDDMGSNISTVANGIQTAYEIGQVAYYSNLVTSGAATLTPLVGTTSVGIVTATGTTTVSGAVATGVSAAAASGSTGVAAIGSAMEAYVGALLNPATIAVAIVVMVVMKVLFGSGCDQGDIQTGMQAASKDCHYIGDYCEKKWPLVGCVQKAKSYCCFNTKMARIIHEQGRPQLVSFGTDGGWGVPSAPNCRGFTPDEFQYLDFSRIDLSEYFEDIQKDLSTKIQGAQTTIQNKVQQHFQATTGGI